MIEALRARLSAVHDNHKRIVAGAAVVGLLMVVAKLFVAGREMAIAWRFGISPTVDAYQLALTIVTWFPTMLASAMTSVLVPRLVSLQRRDHEYRAFIAELNGTVLSIGLAVALFSWLAAPAAAALLASKLDPRALHLTAAMSRDMAPVALFVVMVGYLSVRLQSQERFAYSLTEAVPAIVIAAFVLGGLAMGGGAPLIWGTLAGYFLQALVLGKMTRGGIAGLGSLRLRHRSPEWRSLYGSAAVMAAGQVVLALSLPIDQAFAARVGVGAVATLGYANRVVVLITSFGAVVLARALLPVLSRAVAEGSYELGRRQARQWSGLLFFSGAATTVVGWFAAPAFISLIFERGAFSAEDSRAVATVLRFGLLQLPFFFAGLALVQWTAALRRYSILLIAACFALIMKVVMNLLLVPILGLKGIMIATAGMYAVTFASLYLSAVRAR